MPSDETIRSFQDHAIQYSGNEYRDETFKYRLLTPKKVEPEKKYPLVLFLHGAGERGSDNVAQLKYLPEWMAAEPFRGKYPCFLVAPQCRAEKTWAGLSSRGNNSAELPEPGDQMKVVLQILDHVEKNYPVDRRRIYLTGLSMGGFGTWDLAARMPERFAAAVPICGGGNEMQGAKIASLPIWAWHGDADQAVPVEASRRMIEAIRRAGGNPKYTELAGVGHDSWTPAYTREEGAILWLFEQSRK